MPKHHEATDVPDIYRMAARSKGVFINPALTEPFGLTLIEAAASGLPIVATNDGGPKDIIAHCQNGVLINPLNVKAMSRALLKAILQRDQWQRWSRNGIRGAKRHYTWEGHVSTYLKQVRNVKSAHEQSGISSMTRTRLTSVDRLLVCDIDNTLLGNKAAIKRLIALINDNDNTGFGIATGRNINSTLKVLDEWEIPRPDFLISAVGSEIHYGNGLVKDEGWSKHISHRWQPADIRKAVRRIAGLKLQATSEQLEFKISFNVDERKMPPLSAIRKHLRSHDLHAKLIYSHQAYLDILPIRASKGLAIRYLGMKWGIETEKMLVAGDSGNDEEMLSGNTLGVVVGNYSPELESLRGRPRIYFADYENADGIIEGINHYDFLGQIRFPGET
jgi:sucrose-phosphate synthase